MYEFILFTGNSNPQLAMEVCQYLSVPLGKAKVNTFSDGEIQIEIQENIRGKDVFIMQSTCSPVNDHLIELLLMIDACRRSSAMRITVVVPYYGYARQDKKIAPRVPLSAKLVANLITMAGANRIITMDLHAGQIQGFFDIPVDNIFAAPVLLNYIKGHLRDNTVIVSPDAGGVERARAFAKRLGASLAIIDKRREAPNIAQAMHVIGDVEGKKAIVLDDMVDTAGTLIQAAEALVYKKVQEVHACCVHPVLSGLAIKRISDSPFKSVVVTNTIPLNEKSKACKKIQLLSVAELLGETIIRSHTGRSVSSLFV
jgi:ribose-phosphate pyrophosphokinase